MNFLKAQTAHVVWKSQIEKHIYGINKESDQINLESVGDKNICELGMWLEKNKSILSKSKNFNKVDQLHGQFHDLIKKRAACNDKGNNACLKTREPHNEASHQLKIKLSRLAHDFNYLI